MWCPPDCGERACARVWTAGLCRWGTGTVPCWETRPRSSCAGDSVTYSGARIMGVGQEPHPTWPSPGCVRQEMPVSGDIPHTAGHRQY